MQLLGVDTGGTFTDFVYFDGAHLKIHKVLSTPASPEQAILQGIHEMGLAIEELLIVHGSTVATNALLEGKAVTTAYITNRGLADVLTIGRQARAELYSLTPVGVAPPVPAALCFELDGRLSADGAELEPLNLQQLDALLGKLQQAGVEAVAINMLFSYLNPAQEQALAARLPAELFVSCSADVLSEAGEYERGIATWINASLGPLMRRYLQRLQAVLQSSAAAPANNIAVMQSSGGTIDIDQAAAHTVHLLLSGPAGGLMAARAIGQLAAIDKMLTFDMGGTSTDVALIEGDVQLTSEGRIGRYPIAVPMVDMHTIGAGGGSLATADAGGLLQVGPASAGAAPGPACYGNGGQQPTVTDANVVLGRLPLLAALGGSLQLDAVAAREALGSLAEKLQLSVEQAAAGVIRLANEHMAQALRLISVQRGIDVQDHTLVSFGGAGALHVCALAELMHMRKALVPLNSGVLSAFGMLVAPRQRLFSQAMSGLLLQVPLAEITQGFERLALQGRQALGKEGLQAAQLSEQYSVDLRYLGQSYALTLPWQGKDAVLASFHQAHIKRYGHRMELPVELVNLRVNVTGPAVDLHLPPVPMRPKPSPQRVEVYGYEATVACYQRDSLSVEDVIQGPAIVIESIATTFIEPDWQGQLDNTGNLILIYNKS